ncbi:MAG: SGNH/GDSL hydrolase family protein [Planctomycetes bacterium]|nr:SGNH/GDSL hydrolase family protein [Planctomycetota bacterium]
MSSPFDKRKRGASPLRKLGCSLLAFVVLGWIAVEVLSRRADSVVEARKSDPAFDPKSHTPDLWDKWAFSTLDPLTFGLANARVAAHPFLGYALKPSWRSGPADKLQASHNSLGLRGREVERAKPLGTFRIVTLGGSSVYGSQDSNDDSVWSARLEREFAERLPNARIEVLNGGCIGHNSFEMLANFQFRLLDLEPDVLFVYEAINDMKAALYTRSGVPVQSDNTHYRQAWQSERPGAFDGLFESSRAYLVWRRYFTSWGRERVDLYSYIQRGYGDGSGSWYCREGQDWPAGEVPEQGLVNYRRNLNNLISVAQANGVQVVLATQALVRRHMEREECRATQLATYDRIQAIQKETAAARGAALCDCGPAIVDEVERTWNASAQSERPEPVATSGFKWRQGGDGLWRKDLFHNDVHPYDDGSALIARVVAEWLVGSKLLPR